MVVASVVDASASVVVSVDESAVFVESVAVLSVLAAHAQSAVMPAAMMAANEAMLVHRD